MAIKFENSLNQMSPPAGYFLIFLFVAMAGTSVANAQDGSDTGRDCTGKIKLPRPFLCAEGNVVDCRNSTNSREQLYCISNELKQADQELNHLYQRTLKKLEKPNDEYADYSSARKALVLGQRAWLTFKRSDCEVSGYLNLKGSIQSNDVVACELKHTKNRIADLNAYLIP